MGRRFFSAAICSVLMVLCLAGIAWTTDVVTPQVTLDYDAATFTYTYHVVVPQGNTYPFGQLLIFTKASGWDGTKDTWTLKGPMVGGTDLGWSRGLSPASQGDTAEWRSLSGQEIASGFWTGDFVIIAPGTIPVAGLGMTKDGVQESVNYFNIDVPGVPEPSSLAALASMAGLLGLMIRKRR